MAAAGTCEGEEEEEEEEEDLGEARREECFVHRGIRLELPEGKKKKKGTDRAWR